MKLLIVHASAGAGHRKAAEALYNYIHTHHPEDEVALCDMLDYAHPLFRFFYSNGYAFLINRVSWLWAAIFFFTKLPLAGELIRLFSRWTAILNTCRFSRYLCSEQFDAVVSTHFLPPELIARLRRKGLLKSRIYCVVTDYGVHPFWITQGIDAYCVATERTREILIERGVDAARAHVPGIPIDERFNRQMPRRTAASGLGLDADRFTVLAVTGSFGIGPLEQIAFALSALDLQVLIVCARNTRLKRSLDQKNYQGITAFGFVDNMPDLMAASDMIITKPGGLTITELLACDLVPFFICAIPGQEIENVKILSAYGIGEAVSSAAQVRERVIQLKDHPARLREARANIQKIKKPLSVKAIYEIVRAGCAGVSG